MNTYEDSLVFPTGIKIIAIFAIIGFLGAFFSVYSLACNGAAMFVYVMSGRDMNTPEVRESIILVPSALLCSIMCIYFMSPRVRDYIMHTMKRMARWIEKTIPIIFNKAEEVINIVFEAFKKD